MAKQLTFNEFFNLLYEKNEEIKNELEDIIIASIGEPPSLSEIKDSEIRYEKYARSVKLNTTICRLLSNAYFTKDAVVKAKHKVIKDASTPQKILNQYKLDLDALIEDIDGLILSAKAFKDGLDSELKFFNSACYMFGGILEVKSSI